MKIMLKYFYITLSYNIILFNSLWFKEVLLIMIIDKVMNFFMMIAVHILFAFFLISLFYTIYRYSMIFIEYIKKKLSLLGHQFSKVLDEYKIVKPLKSIIKFIGNIKRKFNLSELLFINTKKKLGIFLFLFPISIIIIFTKYNLTKYKYLNYIAIVCAFIALFCIALYLRYSSTIAKTLGYKLLFYFYNIMIFIIYTSMFFIIFMHDINNYYLFITIIIITLFYSSCFLIGTIDTFKSIYFRIINLILIYIHNLLIFGLTFGFYYLKNNDIFKLFEDADKIKDTASFTNLSIIVQKGLINFFNSDAPILNTPNLINNIIQFGEFIFGNIYTVAIIGFYLSYAFSDKNKNKISKFNEE